MRVTLAITLLFVSFSVFSKELNVPFHKQNTMVWCWAATIAMVAEYVTGRKGEDCEVLSLYDRALGGPGDCCFNSRRCERTGQSSEIVNILDGIYGMDGTYYKRPLSYSEIVDEINADQPFIIALRAGFSGHVVVVTGYRLPNTVIVLDPMSGKHEVPYSQLLSNFTLGNWTETFTVENGGSRKPNSSPAVGSCRTVYVDEVYTDFQLQPHQVQVPCQHCGCGPWGCGCTHPFDTITNLVQVPVQLTRRVPRQVCN